ncbi:MAG: 30S ribosome-binding factor RbfA [Candidatus Cloacimonetes bacterium]|nr:30S ribosome-binding factor RbfA [Candidatus Cloacimonadota bacterium]
MSYRMARLEKEILRILNNALVNKINDQRLQWVTITEVELTPDLQLAKIYFSKLNDEKDDTEYLPILTKASGFLKKEIAAAHILRRIPEIRFFYDDTGNRARKIESLLDKLSDEDKK